MNENIKLSEVILHLAGADNNTIGEPFKASIEFKRDFEPTWYTAVIAYKIETTCYSNGVEETVGKTSIYLPEMRLAVLDIGGITNIDIKRIRAYGYDYGAEYWWTDMKELNPLPHLILEHMNDFEGEWEQPSGLRTELEWTTTYKIPGGM